MTTLTIPCTNIYFQASLHMGLPNMDKVVGQYSSMMLPAVVQKLLCKVVHMTATQGTVRMRRTLVSDVTHVSNTINIIQVTMHSQ